MFSLEQIQEQVLAYIDALVPQTLSETAMPDEVSIGTTLSGNWNPFYTLQFGDIQPYGGKSMVGPRGDDYVLPVYIQATAPTAEIARKMGNRIIDGFLGTGFPYSGSVRKRVGGRVLPLKNSDGATQAFIAPTSFGVTVQLEDIVP